MRVTIESHLIQRDPAEVPFSTKARVITDNLQNVTLERIVCAAEHMPDQFRCSVHAAVT